MDAVTSGTADGFRRATPDDLERLLELNNQAVPAVNELTADELSWFLEVAHLFPVVEDPGSGEVVALLVGLDGPGLAYQSLKSASAWGRARRRRDGCGSGDGVVVPPPAGGGGRARAMYGLPPDSADGHTHLCAEVNTVPRNDRSLEFHERYGFEVVGGQSDEATGKTVSMFALAL
ncbi:MAG: hypothetical protein H8D48_04850 [Actinobacteria bacterium]|nr:hypothetical protein [Actinomycetota bacterium]